MPEITILVADDEAHITQLVAMKLRAEGFKVLVANDGEEALELAQEHHPDLVVTDFQMPILSGFDLCCALKDDARTAQIPVVMVTARGHMLSQEDLARTNIRAMVRKPFSPRLLLDQVRSLLGTDLTDGRGGSRERGIAA